MTTTVDVTTGRPTAPRRAVALAAGVGIAAAVVVPSGPPGAGVLLVGAVAAALVVRTAGARLEGWQRVHGVTALLLLACVVVRDAPWLVTGALLAAAAVATLALTPARSWAGVLAAPLAIARTLPLAAPWLSRGAVQALPQARAAAPAARGVGLTALLLVVFVPLLASADPAFAELLRAMTPTLPSAETLPARLAIAALAACLVGAALQALVWPRPEPVLGAPGRLARRSEWLLPLLALDLLLAGFLLVHGSVLLGGADHVLERAGVTYASYAREGFGQLVAVTALVLAVVAAGARWAPRAARPLLGLLCGLALVVDVSALARLDLYIEAYGLTRLRICATALAVWLGVVLLLVLVAGLRPGRWLPHGVVLAGAVVLLLLTAADPDARIARSALDRGAEADLAYLSSLSADAVPVLDRLPEPARSCVLARRAAEPSPWTSANVARARAAEVLARQPAGACQAATG